MSYYFPFLPAARPANKLFKIGVDKAFDFINVQVCSKKSNWKNTMEIENKHLKKQQKILKSKFPLIA